VNIYDVFRRIIEARAFQDHERVEALHLLDELEALNVLGTTAKRTTEGHDHDWIGWRYGWRRCQICGREEPSP